MKICGITDLQDGLAAAELGANYVGFVFYKKSPLNVDPNHARSISQRLNGVKKVGLFVDEDPEKVRNIADLVGLDVLQFHGNESSEYCQRFQDREVWKAIRVKDEGSLIQISGYSSIDAVVLDAHVDGKMGGTGKSFDWDLAVKAKELGKRIILAGGLDAKNVAEAIRRVDPSAVDVSSGVEKEKGKKSYDKMKAFIDTAKTPSVLLEIKKRKKLEVDMLHLVGMADEYIRKANCLPPTKRFYEAITTRRSERAPNLIAEFKITSPSNMRKGNPDFRSGADPAYVVKEYEEGGAASISVLTDYEGFKGQLAHLRTARETVNLPLLRKDFIIDEAQIYEARYYGADAILLITAILDVEQMERYIGIAASLGMDCLVESHNRYELDKAIAAGARIHGINNRNLHDFSVDINTTLELLPYVPEGKPIVAESGILTYEDVMRLNHRRITGMLIGEGLMKAEDIGAEMKGLLGR